MGLGAKIAESMGVAVMEAATQLDVNIEEDPKPKRRKKKDNSKSEEEAFKWTGPETFEEFCDLEIKRVHDRGLPEPDYDFRDEYHKGQKIYYINNTAHYVNEKQLLTLTIRTIYPRMIVGVEEKSSCHCIGYNERHNVFTDYFAAKQKYESLGGTYSTEKETDNNDESNDESDL